MLRLENIVKTYVTGELRQTALKGVSISFREHEFVSILGQSGSGKTTLLNIIGGLDRYDSGDLVIDGCPPRTTRTPTGTTTATTPSALSFRATTSSPTRRCWPMWRWPSPWPGCPRRSAASGRWRCWRRWAWGPAPQAPQPDVRGPDAAGGHRRALINHPTILLADEPTGALDSETSVQIMDLLQEIARTPWW